MSTTWAAVLMTLSWERAPPKSMRLATQQIDHHRLSPLTRADLRDLLGRITSSIKTTWHLLTEAHQKLMVSTNDSIIGEHTYLGYSFISMYFLF